MHNTLTQLISNAVIYTLLLTMVGPIFATPLVRNSTDYPNPKNSYRPSASLATLLHPLSQDFFKRLSFGYGVSLGLFPHSQFSSLGFSSTNYFSGFSFEIDYLRQDKASLGIHYLTGSKRALSLISSGHYSNTRVFYETYHITLTHALYHESGVQIDGHIGLGLTTGGYQISTIHETAGGDFGYKERTGSAPSSAIGLRAHYFLNPYWMIHLDTSYFYANIKDLKTPLGNRDVNALTIPLTGPIVTFSTAHRLF